MKIVIGHNNEDIIKLKINIVNKDVYILERKEDKLLNVLIPENPTYDNIMNFLKSRITTKNRDKEFLNKNSKSIFDLLKLTDGQKHTDNIRIDII